MRRHISIFSWHYADCAIRQPMLFYFLNCIYSWFEGRILKWSSHVITSIHPRLEVVYWWFVGASHWQLKSFYVLFQPNCRYGVQQCFQPFLFSENIFIGRKNNYKNDMVGLHILSLSMISRSNLFHFQARKRFSP